MPDPIATAQQGVCAPLPAPQPLDAAPTAPPQQAEASDRPRAVPPGSTPDPGLPRSGLTPVACATEAAFDDVPAEPLSEADYLRFVGYLKLRTGLNFGLTKRYYVDKRLRACLDNSGAENFLQWFTDIRNDPNGSLWDEVVRTMTVNETYFFRERHQFDCMAQHLLNERLQARGESRRNDPLRVWSVPSSTGEEPYSIAIWLTEHWPALSEQDVQILASDIDTRVLGDAVRGEYGRRAVAHLPPNLLERHFEPLGDGEWRIHPDLVASVDFSQHNLCEPRNESSPGCMDLIFCRNVLIYFDDVTQQRVLQALHDALLPGGFLCLGHAESLPSGTTPLQARRFPQGIVYQRPPLSASVP